MGTQVSPSGSRAVLGRELSERWTIGGALAAAGAVKPRVRSGAWQSVDTGVGGTGRVCLELCRGQGRRKEGNRVPRFCVLPRGLHSSVSCWVGRRWGAVGRGLRRLRMPAAGGTRSAKGRRAGRRPGSQRGERGLLGLLLGGGGVFAGWKRVHVGQRACSRGGCARLRRFSGGCGQDRVRATSRNAAACVACGL